MESTLSPWHQLCDIVTKSGRKPPQAAGVTQESHLEAPRGFPFPQFALKLSQRVPWRAGSSPPAPHRYLILVLCSQKSWGFAHRLGRGREEPRVKFKKFIYAFHPQKGSAEEMPEISQWHLCDIGISFLNKHQWRVLFHMKSQKNVQNVKMENTFKVHN